MIKRQIAVAVLIIVFLVSIALAASAGPLRAQDPTSPSNVPEHHLLGSVESTDANTNSIDVLLKSGHHRSIKLTSSATIVTFTPTKKLLTLNDVKKGDHIAIASSNTATNPTIANLIVLLPPASSNTRLVRGTISDFSGKSFNLTQAGNKSLKISLSDFTICSKKEHDSPALTDCQTLANSNQVLVVGTVKDNSIIATLVHITP